MMAILIKNASIVNEGVIKVADVLIENDYIVKIGVGIPVEGVAKVVDATGKYLLPGAIDDQVHFREPGLTHKADIYSEAKSAVAGGVTSFMEMPNTVPPTTTIDLLEQKYTKASAVSLANYSFFMGTTNNNLEELLKVDFEKVCGVKIFMGSSTGDMLVDNQQTLEKVFSQVKSLIAVHCEDDVLVKENAALFAAKFGDNLSVQHHPAIRSAEACYNSSSFAVGLAKKFGTRLHILHISTEKELELFRNDIPLKDKKITAEACIHHLWFSEEDYAIKGNNIKWNPAVKKKSDRDAILQAVLDDRIDVIATDHAPHTMEEKAQVYAQAPSGGPLLQHSVVAMLELYHQGKISLEKIVQKMSHHVADLFRIQKRGYIREGYFADIVLVDLDHAWTVDKSNVLSKCGWSPFEGDTFKSSIFQTYVSGHLVYDNGVFNEQVKGQRLLFNVAQ
jgi:dihydroorotase